MAREEQRTPCISNVQSNTLWMDIKILDPEMESLMKELNEEQQRLKEALKEKLKLMRYDTIVLQKENQETKEWLRSKGVQLEEECVPIIKEECEVKIKEESIDIESYEYEYNGESTNNVTEATSKAVLREPEVNGNRFKTRKPRRRRRITKQAQEGKNLRSRKPDNVLSGERARRNVPLINYDESEDTKSSKRPIKKRRRMVERKRNIHRRKRTNAGRRSEGKSNATH